MLERVEHGEVLGHAQGRQERDYALVAADGAEEHVVCVAVFVIDTGDDGLHEFGKALSAQALGIGDLKARYADDLNVGIAEAKPRRYQPLHGLAADAGQAGVGTQKRHSVSMRRARLAQDRRLGAAGVEALLVLQRGRHDAVKCLGERLVAILPASRILLLFPQDFLQPVCDRGPQGADEILGRSHSDIPPDQNFQNYHYIHFPALLLNLN